MFKSPYVKALFIVVIVILIGLNITAQSSHRMVPDLPQKAVEWKNDNQMWLFFALGEKFQWDVQDVSLFLGRIGTKTQESLDNINLLYVVEITQNNFKKVWGLVSGFITSIYEKWRPDLHSLLVTWKFLSYN